MIQKNQKNTQLSRLKFTVTDDWVNFRLDKLFFFLQPQWTKVFIYKMIDKKEVKVNSQKTQANYHLKFNDVVDYYGLPIDQIKKTPTATTLPKLDVIHEDDNVIIVNKPPKVAVQNNPNDLNSDSMNDRLLQHLKFEHNTWKPVFVHRLDTNTTGLLVGAKNYETYCQLFAVFKDQKIKKEYLALVFGKVKFETKVIKNHLLKHDNFVFVDAEAGAYSKFAHTNLKLMHQFPKHALLHVGLKTGRTHQIRVHLAHINYPICGDRKYSKHPQNKLFPYQALSCYKLSFFPEVCKKRLADLKNKEFVIQDPWFLNEKYLQKI